MQQREKIISSCGLSQKLHYSVLDACSTLVEYCSSRVKEVEWEDVDQIYLAQDRD
jgi:hypothetical protein